MTDRVSTAGAVAGGEGAGEGGDGSAGRALTGPGSDDLGVAGEARWAGPGWEELVSVALVGTDRRALSAVPARWAAPDGDGRERAGGDVGATPREPGSTREAGSVREAGAVPGPGAVREPGPVREAEAVPGPGAVRESGSVRGPGALCEQGAPPEPAASRDADPVGGADAVGGGGAVGGADAVGGGGAVGGADAVGGGGAVGGADAVGGGGAVGGADAVGSAGAVGGADAVGSAGAIGGADAVGSAGAIGGADAVGSAGAIGDADAVGSGGAVGDAGAVGGADPGGSAGAVGGADPGGGNLGRGSGGTHDDGDPGGNGRGVRDSAVALLEMAAVRTVERRAGQRLNRGESLPVAPREDRPVVSRAAADRLARILGGELPRLLPEWLAAAAGAGLRLPAYLLPEVLDRAARDRSLRSHAGALAGQRGRWLARVGAAQWAYLLEEPTGDGETWQLGTPGDRRELMRRMRRDDPGAAREMLAGTWEKETPDDRAAFLAAFGEGLSMDDEEFLEAALDDRRREVRQCAADLLTRLPESRLARRMVARAGQCLRPADTGPGSDSDSGSGSGSGSDSGFGFGFGFGSGSGSGSASGDSGSASRPGSDSARPGFASGPGPGFASGPGSGFASRPGSGPASRPGPGPASRPGSGSGAVERGPVRRVVVEPPSACDAAAQRDGVRPTPPRGTGEKGWWLQQIVARTPLTYWTELFGAEPDAIVRMDFGDWQREVRGGWVRAAVLQRDPAWARALFAWDPLAELLAALPAGEREELAAGFVREQAVDGQMIMVLGGAEAPWGPVLTRAVLAKIVEVAGEQPWNVDELARLVAERADPGLHAAAERLSSEPSVQAIAAVLRFRSDMLKELS